MRISKSSTGKSLAPIETAVLLALVLTLLWQCHLVRKATSTTYDETIYATFASMVVRHGSMKQFAEYGTAPLPVLFNYLVPALAGPTITPPTSSWNEVRVPPWMVQWARCSQSLIIGIGLVLGGCWWLWPRHSASVGLLAAALIAFSPSIIAHTSLATTDAPFSLAVLITLAVMARYIHSRTESSTRSSASPAWVGVAIGVALAAKYSGMVLLPIAGLAISVANIAGPSKTNSRLNCWVTGCVRDGAILIAAAFVVWWAIHGFGWVQTPTGPSVASATGAAEGTLLLPAPLGGFLKQLRMARDSRPVFLAGEISQRGWWYYFPVAFLVKSTLAEIVLAAVALVGTLVRIGKHRRSLVDWMTQKPEQWLPLATATLYLLAAMQSTMNTGHRYLLPLYPLLAIAGIDILAEPLDRRRSSMSPRFPSRVAWCMVSCLVALQIGSVVGIAPHYLAYFNALAGGPEAGHKWLVDSSLDWGQDLPALAKLLDQEQTGDVVLAYFGTANPADYGIRGVDWRQADASAVERCGAVAVSATFLHGVYLGADVFTEFRCLPCKSAGFSIFVYSLADPAVRTATRKLLASSANRTRDAAADGPSGSNGS